MDNVFRNSGKEIQSVRDTRFLQHLHSNILEPVSSEILQEILLQTDVYIFSGVIRDYFLERAQETRDLDIVLEHEINWWSIYRRHRKQLQISINSYGGLKVTVGNLHVDIWSMGNTWGIKRKGIRLTVQNLIRTALFNFSAIAYSVRRERFYLHKSFVDFLQTRRIGIQYKENPNIPLCIVNALHYSNTLNLPLTPELKQWISQRYNMFDNYIAPQLSHWGAIKYSHEDIHRFVSLCES